MSGLKNKAVVFCAVAALAVIGTFMNSRQSAVQAAGGPIVMIDPAQLPLQVSGTTTVSGTVNLAPNASVNLASGASVLVANPASNPVKVRDLDNPARNTFQAIFQNQCTGSLGSIACTGGVTVPTTNGAGAPVSMLEIQSIGGSCGGTGAGVIPVTNYSSTQLNSIIGFFISTTTSTSGYFLQEFFTPDQTGFSQETHLYAAPGTTIVGVSNNCTLTVSGHFVTP